ncbi:MAG: AAA family ATPase, partial [Gammaproteobacteria bacterium]|nr:AAA family ATPase [Gammaproteobacteria bacterium]
MKISKVVIRNFKRFSDETFDLDGHVVVAGPNNSGKTTLLQAIATWHLALTRWRELNNYRRPRGAYAKAPIARQAFYSVPLRAFDLLWHQRSEEGRIEIEVTCDNVRVPVEIIKDSSEQVYVRPLPPVPVDWLKNFDNFPKPVFVPAMSGLSTEEPVYQRPKINQLLGQGKPGDVLRNLLVEASEDQDAWERLTTSIKTMFDYVLLPPNTDGPNIIAEYQHHADGARYDIASAGSGFLQVLMLLTFLNSRQGTVLLLDEPDAHLHVILQDGIYSELRSSAQTNNSQLIIATHSEIVINAVDPRELCALVGAPRKLANDAERASLILSLSSLSNLDLVLAHEKKKVLYLEGHTDLDLLRVWAHLLSHRLAGFMEQPFWKPAVFETRQGAAGIKADNHFEALLLAQEEIRGAQVIDRDGNENIPGRKLEFDDRFLRLCWSRYEIESYLVHPEVLARFVDRIVGPTAELANGDVMKKVMREYLPGR